MKDKHMKTLTQHIEEKLKINKDYSNPKIVAKNKKCTKKAKTYTIKKGTATKKVIRKLSKGKYYVRIRAFKKLEGNTVYGVLSEAKKVKVK